jgi:hypothetical protein
MTRIIGLTSWYEESGVWLAAMATSAAKVCDHLVAVDGAYALYPDSRPQSGSEQAAIIQEAAKATGMGSTIHTPSERWFGNEVEKRTFMFHLAEAVSEPDDWFIILDADETIVEAPNSLKDRLAAADEDVGEVMFWERKDLEQEPEEGNAARQFDYPPESRFPVRILFRAIRGIHCAGNHYTYRTPDGARSGKQPGHRTGTGDRLPRPGHRAPNELPLGQPQEQPARVLPQAHRGQDRGSAVLQVRRAGQQLHHHELGSSAILRRRDKCKPAGGRRHRRGTVCDKCQGRAQARGPGQGPHSDPPSRIRPRWAHQEERGQVRIAVIGLGVMGRNHKRVLERLGHEVVTVDPAGHADCLTIQQAASAAPASARSPHPQTSSSR